MQWRSLRRERLLIVVLVAYLLGHWTMSHAIPALLERGLRMVAGDALTVGSIRLALPFRVVLSRVSWTPPAPWTAASSEKIVIVPQWISWSRRKIGVARLEIDTPRLRVRRTPAGELTWPFAADASADILPDTALSSDTAPVAAPSVPAAPVEWSLRVETVEISDGTLEFVDDRHAFRGELNRVSFIAGPVTLPLHGDRFSIAVQGRVAGAEAREAPIYCSGWVHLDHHDMDLSCKLEPLPLAAFEPYYEGPLKRVKDATFTVTSHVTAKDNVLDGKAQLAIANVSEQDLSVVGRTLADLRKVEGEERTLTGELQLSGPMDDPPQWKLQLVPGNEIVQKLIGSLLARRIDAIPFKMGEQLINVELPVETEATQSTIEEASKTVQETLELIAPTLPPPVVEDEAAVAPEGAPAETVTAAPAALAETADVAAPEAGPAPAPSSEDAPAAAQP